MWLTFLWFAIIFFTFFFFIFYCCSYYKSKWRRIRKMDTKCILTSKWFRKCCGFVRWWVYVCVKKYTPFYEHTIKQTAKICIWIISMCLLYSKLMENMLWLRVARFSRIIELSAVFALVIVFVPTTVGRWTYKEWVWCMGDTRFDLFVCIWRIHSLWFLKDKCFWIFKVWREKSTHKLGHVCHVFMFMN